MVLRFQHQFIPKLGPKTGKVTRYPVPVSKPAFRRVASDPVTQLELPVPYASAYDVQFDSVKYGWGAPIEHRPVQRLNVQTGEWNS